MPNVLAPELDSSLTWLNCPPQRLASHRGHPQLLLFWNAGSAHCQNALQAFAGLAARYRGRASFLAVHVPKFDSERDGELALAQLRRQGAAVPLANDGDWAAWQHFELGAWPTLLLLDPQGVIARRFVGDRELDGAAAALDEALDAGFAQVSGVTAVSRLEADASATFLDAPGGLAIGGNRLYVADTGHHRLLECTLDGRVIRRIGTGNRDFVDGLAETSSFSSPAGLALLQGRLYVADAGNHALRRVDVRTGEVDTLVGSGKAGDPEAGPVTAASAGLLDRPCGVAASESRLLFTQASGHSLWTFELGRGELHRLSGVGTLGTEDGDADSARFAQPSALCLAGEFAYVVDAASSSLRQVRLADGSVRTLFGRGLYEFGHRDGGARHALMQNPLSIAAMSNGQGLWIADAGNGLLRRVLFRNQALTTVALPSGVTRPSALAVAGGQLFIADAGRHALWRMDEDTGEAHRLPVGD